LGIRRKFGHSDFRDNSNGTQVEGQKLAEIRTQIADTARIEDDAGRRGETRTQEIQQGLHQVGRA
jgi:hypothetical protein